MQYPSRRGDRAVDRRQDDSDPIHNLGTFHSDTPSTGKPADGEFSRTTLEGSILHVRRNPPIEGASNIESDSRRLREVARSSVPGTTSLAGHSRSECGEESLKSTPPEKARPSWRIRRLGATNGVGHQLQGSARTHFIHEEEPQSKIAEPPMVPVAHSNLIMETGRNSVNIKTPRRPPSAFSAFSRGSSRPGPRPTPRSRLWIQVHSNSTNASVSNANRPSSPSPYPTNPLVTS